MDFIEFVFFYLYVDELVVGVDFDDEVFNVESREEGFAPPESVNRAVDSDNEMERWAS